MANEVIIEEYGDQIYASKGNISGSAMPKLITTQILSIATASATLNGATKYAVVQSKGTGFWIVGGPSAVANTAGNIWVPADGSKELVVDGFTVIDTAA